MILLKLLARLNPFHSELSPEDRELRQQVLQKAKENRLAVERMEIEANLSRNPTRQHNHMPDGGG